MYHVSEWYYTLVIDLVSSVNVLSNVIVDVTIPRRSFVFGQSRVKVSAGFTNVRGLAVAAFDLVYSSPSLVRTMAFFMLETLKSSSVKTGRTKVDDLILKSRFF